MYHGGVKLLKGLTVEIPGIRQTLHKLELNLEPPLFFRLAFAHDSTHASPPNQTGNGVACVPPLVVRRTYVPNKRGDHVGIVVGSRQFSPSAKLPTW